MALALLMFLQQLSADSGMKPFRLHGFTGSREFINIKLYNKCNAMTAPNKRAILITGLASALLFSKSAYAHCPLCTAAVGAGAVAATAVGVDVSVVGLFVGAFAVSTGLWFGRIIKKKYIPFQTALIVFASFLLTIIPVDALVHDTIYFPLLYFGVPGSVFNRVWWMPKMLFGGIIGGALTVGSLYLHEFLKKRNNGKVHIQFQGVLLTVGILAISAIAMFLAMR